MVFWLHKIIFLVLKAVGRPQYFLSTKFCGLAWFLSREIPYLLIIIILINKNGIQLLCKDFTVLIRTSDKDLPFPGVTTFSCGRKDFDFSAVSDPMMRIAQKLSITLQVKNTKTLRKDIMDACSSHMSFIA